MIKYDFWYDSSVESKLFGTFLLIYFYSKYMSKDKQLEHKHVLFIFSILEALI